MYAHPRISSCVIGLVGMMFASACSNGDGQSGPAPIVTGTMTDIEGNVYPTVIIGKQEWMAANLKTTTYNDGTPIPQVTDASAWSSILLGGAYSWYDNDLANKEVYGALYNWSTVETGKLCPTGWDVPVSENWGALTDYLGGKDALGQNLDGKVVAGGKLKEKGTLHWQSPNTGATMHPASRLFPADAAAWTGHSKRWANAPTGGARTRMTSFWLRLRSSGP